MIRPLLPVFLIALVAACSNQQVAAPAPEEESAAPATDVAEVELPERRIPDDSLYPLLLAEFALRRRDYNVALENYLQLAPELRDPGVSAHATHLAQFMQREQEALEAVQLWVELEPEQVEANGTLATLLVRQGRTPEALPHLARVQAGGGSANFPMLMHGFDRLSPQQRAQLVAGVNELAQHYPDNPQLLVCQALLHEEMGQDAAALDKLERLFEIEPYQNQGLLLEAKLLLEGGEENPFARIEEALEQNPEDQRLRLQYARLLTRSDINAAREQFEILSAQAPRDADLLFSLALINREVGDNIEARAYLRQMLQLGQREGEAYYYLGRMDEDEGELQSAVSNYMKVTGGRDFLSANNRIGRILIDNGQVDRSRAWFNELRQRHPDQAEQLYGLEADLLMRGDQLDAALDVLNQALRELPDSASLRYTRSMVGEQRNDLALMENDLRTIIDRDPDNATALNALGYTLANRTDRYDEAYELITRALALQPEEPAILDSMGWILYRQGDYAQALEYLTRAYAKFPDPEVAAHLGEVLWVSGDTSSAMNIWKGALLKDPEHKVLVGTLRRLGVTGLESPAE